MTKQTGRFSLSGVREHEAIVRAIEAGDPKAAHEQVRSNWRNASDRLRGVMEREAQAFMNGLNPDRDEVSRRQQKRGRSVKRRRERA